MLSTRAASKPRAHASTSANQKNRASARHFRPLPQPVVLLAQTEAGYENLMKLNSCLYVDKGGALPAVTLEELEAHLAPLRSELGQLKAENERRKPAEKV